MILAAITDVTWRRIPNLLTACSGLTALLLSLAGQSVGPIEAVVTSLIVGIPLAALAMFRPDGFGMGDAKLIGVMALFMGWGLWVPLVSGLGVATVTGTAISLAGSTGDGPVCLPLAPFLALVTVPFVLVAMP